MLVKDPRNRLGFGPNGVADIKADPFFANIDWKALYDKKTKIPEIPHPDLMLDLEEF